MKTFLLLLITPLLFTACGSGPDSSPETTTPVNPAISSVFRELPDDASAVPIPEARTEKQPGDSVVLAGRIMGVMEPFIESRAVFVLGDNSVITPCSDMETDHCPTPWDACCDPSSTRAEGTATIQIVDESGQLLRQGLEGVNGLEKLASVKVSGTVNKSSSANSLIVNAESIEVID